MKTLIDPCVKKVIADPIYIMDYTTPHTAAKLKGIKLGRHPALSPDFNKPVEHFHAELGRRFKEWLDSDEGEYTHKQYRKRLWGMAQSVPAEFFDKAVRSLPEMWRCIAKSTAEGGVDGGWPPAPLRK